MSATALLDDLRSRGVELAADGGNIRLRAPKGVLAPGDRAALAEYKPEILAELGAERAWATVEAIAAEMRRRAIRALELDEWDSAEDRFVSGHHRDEVRLMVTRDWLPAMQRHARAQRALGRLDPELAHLVDAGDEAIAAPEVEP